MINGRARIEEGGALDVMDSLSEYYLGPGERYPWREAPPGFTVRVDLDKVYGQGSWRTAGDDSTVA